MISELCLTRTQNAFELFIGIDSFEHCVDKLHFTTYNTQIIYNFNSLGYRDDEWPADILNNIWCIGDSFTVGLGQPLEETWPQLISAMLDKRIINVSMNGASNDWIARRASYIIKHFNPFAILIQWSYVHRREDRDHTKLDEDRAIWYSSNDDDLENLINNIASIDFTNVVHSFIPKFYAECDIDSVDTYIYEVLKKENIIFFPPISHIDYARDGYHYGHYTALEYAKTYCTYINV